MVLTWWMVKYFRATLLVCATLVAALVIGLVGRAHEGILRLADLWRR